MPSSPARRTTSAARIPVSTLTISFTPSAAAALHHLRPHAVAVLEPVRNVVAGGAAGQLDGLGQQHHRRGAVHVVIAVDQDLLAAPDGRPQALDGPRHVAQRSAGRAGRRAGVQEAARRGRIGQPAMHQHLGGRPTRNARGGAASAAACPGIGRGQDPARWPSRSSSWRSSRPADRRRRPSSSSAMRDTISSSMFRNSSYQSGCIS